MKKTKYILIAIGLLSLIVLSACAPSVNQTSKRNCENSGGQYKLSTSETGGTNYYCSCPDNKYEMNKICNLIGQIEMSKCEQESNQYVDCTINSGACECVFKNSGTKSYIPIAQLMTLNCACSSNSCLCAGEGLNLE